MTSAQNRSWLEAGGFWRSGANSLPCLTMLTVVWTASAQVQQAWVARYDYHNSIEGFAAMETDGVGNTYITGISAGEFAIVKFSPSGNELWSARYLGPGGNGIIDSYPVAMGVDSAGAVCVTGTARSTDYYENIICDEFDQHCHTHRVSYDVFWQVTVKYDTSGRKLWDAKLGVGDTQYGGWCIFCSASAIAVDSAGGVIVTGSGGTVKYDASGTPVAYYGASGIALALDNANNVYVGDYYLRPGGIPFVGSDYVSDLIKFDGNGARLWNAPGQGGPRLIVDAVGDAYVSCSADGLTKFDSIGNELWTSSQCWSVLRFDPAGNLYVPAAKISAQGHYLWWAAGYNSSTDVAADAAGNAYTIASDVITKYDPSGNTLWRISAGSSNGFARIALDNATNIYVGGIASDATGSDFVVMKYVQNTNTVPGRPRITTHPLSQIVRPGSDVALWVSSEGSPALTYQWLFNQVPLAGATNSTLMLPDMTPAQTGAYSVQVSNSIASTMSLVAFITILHPLDPPALTSCVTFTPQTSGSGPLEYQWQFNGTNLPGATHRTLMLTNLSPSIAGEYAVVVSSFGNALTSTVVRLNPSAIACQAWTVTPFGASSSESPNLAVASDAMGNAYVASSYYTVKYAPDGQLLWANSYEGGGGYDGSRALAVDQVGNVLVTGISYGTNGTGYDFATVKIDSRGQLVWVARYDGGQSEDGAFAVALDPLGNVYVTGYSVGHGFDYLTIKYDPAGHQLWAAKYDGGYGHDFAYALALGRSGGVYVSGASLGDGTGYDFAVVKYDAGGNQLWATRYNGPGNRLDTGRHLVVGSDDNVIVTGWSDGGAGRTNDFATVKYDSAGRLLWVARYNGPGNGEDNPHGVGVDSRGNVFVTGSSVGADGRFDFATVKYDRDGHELWLRRYSGPGGGDDYARALNVDTMGNIYVTGASYDGGNEIVFDIATLKYDTEGVLQWVARYDGTAHCSDEPYALTVNGDAIYIAGTTDQGYCRAGSNFPRPYSVLLKYNQIQIVPVRLADSTLLPNRQFRALLLGQAGDRYTIQASPDLVNWAALTNFVSITGTNQFTDPAESNFNRRFYRAVTP